MKIIIEFDGKMHFEFIDYFHQNIEKFQASQERDVYKHWLALKDGYKIIRIDDLIPKNQIEEHLIAGLNSIEREYFSTPSLYEPLIKSVNEFVLPN